MKYKLKQEVVVGNKLGPIGRFLLSFIYVITAIFCFVSAPFLLTFLIAEYPLYLAILVLCCISFILIKGY